MELPGRLPDPRGRLPDPLATALAAGIAGVAGSYAATGGTSAFVGVPVNAVVVDLMPAPIVTFSILVLGTIGEAVGFAIALAIVVALIGAGAAAATRIGRAPAEVAVATAAFAWVVAFAVTGVPLDAAGTAVPAGAAAWFVERAAPGATPSESRRRLLKSLGGALAFAGGAYVVGDRITGSRSGNEPPLSELLAEANPEAARTVDADVDRLVRGAADKELDVEGVPGLVSPTPEFYEVDINWIDPDVSPGGWTLSVTGMVDEEFEVGYRELLGMEPEHRVVTLRCVSDPLNGELIDNAVWTGVPVERLLDRADPQGDRVVLRARDGYYEDFPLEAFEGGFLAYGMNGHVLPRPHGYPVRALVLGHWGEVNVKWVERIEIAEGNVLGYWEKRGWHGTGPVHPVAKLRAVNRLDDGRVQVAGHAYAGVRGVSAVEVSTDGGETWAEARLSARLDSPDAWRQWAHEWEPSERSHSVVVRAVDDDGNVQSSEPSQPHPSGATGWVRREVSAEGESESV